MNATDNLSKALQLRQEGQVEEALQLLLKLHAAFPNDPAITYECGATHDKLGRETEAIPFYELAIEQGLSGDLLRGALLGLGSSYRCIGEYEKAAEVLRRGVATFPDGREFETFLAMALHNLGRYDQAMEILLRNLAETSSNERILSYRRAILFYADKLDQTWL
jgi:tetratricopeptide (TPR) repeat protein